MEVSRSYQQSLSSCGRYCYSVEHEVFTDLDGSALFVLPRPLPAHGQSREITVRRCASFCRAWGYRQLLLGYINPLMDRHKQPSEDALEMNEIYIEAQSNLANITVAAWGPSVDSRLVSRVLKRLSKTYVLGLDGDGTPLHPLAAKFEIAPKPYGG